MKNSVKSFILKYLKNTEINEGTNLIESGILDSMSFLDLISALEQQFSVSIDFGERDPNEFLTLGGLIKLVTPKE